MKTLIYALSLAAIFVVTGCEDFLDTDNLTEKTTANFPATETEANEMLTSIYANLLFEGPDVSSATFLAQLASDDCLGGNVSYSDNCAMNFLMYKNLNFFGFDNGVGNGGVPMWNRLYKLINRANAALASYDNVKVWSAGELERHLGETYFLRAYAYNDLVQVFGGVPLRTTTEATNIPRASVDEVYELIASDLKNAIELLPDRIYSANSAMDGHVTKYAAEALMARIFLFYTGRYAKTELPGGITKQQVIGWIDDCVENSGYDLVDDQRNIWSYTNEVTETNAIGKKYAYVANNNLKWEGNSSKETVFATKYKLKGNGWSYTWFSNTVCQYMSPASSGNTKQSYPFGSGWGAGPVSPAMVNEWKIWSQQQTYIDGETEDPRLTGSIWSYKAYNPDTKEELIDKKLTQDEPDYTVNKIYWENTGYYQKKYINILAYTGGAGSDDTNSANYTSYGVVMYPDNPPAVISASLNNISDLIHIRFADVLLMQSELKEDATGLNRVRARSHLAPVAYSLKAIQDERRWEFAFESIRWWDLLRWSGPSLDFAGDALNKQTDFEVVNGGEVKQMVNFDYKKRLKEMQGYWYIPQIEIDRANGVLEQNPGWDASAQFVDWGQM